ncbi:DNA metabolism protein [Lithospermum erythrorhizon]|uniref:DNA-(apurinic or apyrimidinic site) lyase n=1 Tax=Lithospermum erythrorhizon TaxID=34254 RepID=A0AAV3RI76_LITER
MSLRHLYTMKRKSPSTPHHLTHFKPLITSSKTSLIKNNIITLNKPNWTPLNVQKSELNLSLTFPTGQTFRFRQTGQLQFTGVIAGSYVVSLKEWEDGNIWYCMHGFGKGDSGGELLEKLVFDKNGAKLLEKTNLDKNGGGELLEKLAFGKNGDDGLLENLIFDDNGAEFLEKSSLDENGGGELLEKLIFDKNGGGELLEKSVFGNNGYGELLEKSVLDINCDDWLLEKSLLDKNGAELLEKSLVGKNGDGDVELLEKSLFDFLNMGISLSELWGEFKANDERFAELAECFPGVRVLRQDPLECLIQFICSSNNNISRITKMVDYISALGRKLGSVGGFDFYAFPSLDRLAMLSEAELRGSGFGYRAKYIIGTVKALQSKPGGGVEWLASLRKASLEDAVVALCTLPGVGPKVAACVALFSLDQHHAIPVDTHVWQIATRHLIPELAGTTLTPKLHDRVANAFVSKYGKYAGWAQTLLFIADLPSQKAILNSPSKTIAMDSLITQKEGKRKKVKREILKNM